MKYDFETILDRKGHDALALDSMPVPGVEVKEGFSPIPMWVADMNFPTLPTILEEIRERLEHPHFGYFMLPDQYFESIMNWHRTRFGVKGLYRDCIGYENGVLGCVASAVQAFTAPGEAVLLHSPTYIGFTGTLENSGRKIVLSDLVQDEDGVWRMDYEDMEDKIVENHIHCAVFCSPHNPTGRVWEKEELERVMELFRRHDCIVISDEIWADIVLPGARHIPTQTISEDAKNRTIAVYATTKTFNLAGLVGSYHVIYNKYLRDRVEKVSSMSHYNMTNVLSVHALIGAYKEEGSEWVDELCQVLGKNAEYAYGYIKDHFKGVSLAKPQGTYMLYLDCEAWCREHGKTMDELLEAGIRVGVVWQDGRPFHRPWAIRVNLAVPYARVVDAMERLDRYVFNGSLEEIPRKKAGDRLPDFTADTPFVKGKKLSDLVGKKTAVVFLRYYGCTLCQLELQQYAKEYQKIKNAGCDLIVVLQSDPDLVAEELGTPEKFPFAVLCDPGQEMYRELNIPAAESIREMIGEKEMQKIQRARIEGLRHGAYEGEELQKPAMFLVDEKLNILYAHYGKTAGDVPNAREIAKLAREN